MLIIYLKWPQIGPDVYILIFLISRGAPPPTKKRGGQLPSLILPHSCLQHSFRAFAGNRRSDDAFYFKFFLEPRICGKHIAIILQYRALDHQNLGPKFSPIPNAKKYGFFSNFRRKIPNLTKPTWSKKLQIHQLKISIKTVRKQIKCADY